MIYRFEGNMRGGKTLNATAWAVTLSALTGQTIYANYHINWPWFVFFEKWRDLSNVTDSLIIVDEIATMVDSRNYKSKDQMYFTHLFAQMGKKGNTFFYTSQRDHMVEKRVKDQTDYVIKCWKDWVNGTLNQEWFDTQRSVDEPVYINTLIMEKPQVIYPLYDTYEVVSSQLNTTEIN